MLHSYEKILLMKQQDTEKQETIDITDFLKLVWNGKLVIILFVTIFFLLGLLYDSSKTDTYKSVIKYYENITPPFQDYGKVTRDFKNLFYTKHLFNSWKKINKNSQIQFKDLVLEDISSDWPEFSTINSMVYFEKDKYVSVLSNEFIILKDIYNYSDYVNAQLSVQYVSEIENYRDKVKISYSGFGVTLGIEEIIIMEKFINSVESGDYVLNIEYPTIPVETSLIRSYVITIFTILGLIIGLIIVFFRGFLN